MSISDICPPLRKLSASSTSIVSRGPPSYSYREAEKKHASVIEKDSAEVDEVTHEDLKEIAIETTPYITDAFEENSFQRLFRDQQVKALHAKVENQWNGTLWWWNGACTWGIFLEKHMKPSVNQAVSDSHRRGLFEIIHTV